MDTDARDADADTDAEAAAAATQTLRTRRQLSRERERERSAAQLSSAQSGDRAARTAASQSGVKELHFSRSILLLTAAASSPLLLSTTERSCADSEGESESASSPLNRVMTLFVIFYFILLLFYL